MSTIQQRERAVVGEPTDSARDFAWRRDRIEVTALSPDRTVRARATHRDGITVRLRPGCLAGHSSESVSGQLRAAILAAATGYRRAVAEALRAADDRVRRAAAARRFAETVAPPEVVAVSSDGHLVLAWSGCQPIRVRVRRGSLVHLDEERLTVAVNSTLRIGTAEYERRLARVLGDDPDNGATGQARVVRSTR